MKTAEELAIMIQDGDKSRIPELWERVRGIYAMKSLRWYSTHRALCARCGVELEDIQQQSFFAFLKSIELYEPQCELAFTSYINFPFLNEMQELTRTRSSGQRADCLNQCGSLDKTIETEDGGGETVGDFVPDPDALFFVELLDAESVAGMIRNEVQQLPDREREIIAGFYFDGQTLEQLAQRLGVTLQRISQLKKRGLVTLSQRRALVDLWNEMHHTNELRKLEKSTLKNSPEQFDAKRSYDRQIRTKAPSAWNRARDAAEELRRQRIQSGGEWTREDEIKAITDALLSQAATAP